MEDRERARAVFALEATFNSGVPASRRPNCIWAYSL